MMLTMRTTPSRGATLALVAACILVLPLASALVQPIGSTSQAHPKWGAWHTQNVTSDGIDREGFTVDAAGYGHVLAAVEGKEHYVWTPDGITWHDEIVPTPHYAAFDEAIAYDWSGTLHGGITTNRFDSDGAHLYYATRSSTGTWTLELVDSAPNGEVGISLRLFFDATDSPHMTYLNGATTGSGEVHAYKDATGWHRETVDGRGGIFQSGVIDSTGTIHVCYSINGDNPVAGNEMYAKRSPSGTWTIETIDHSGGLGCGIAVDSAGVVHVIHTNAPYVGLEYATRTAGTWAITEIESGRAYTTDIQLDSHGLPQVVYDQLEGGSANDPTTGHLYFMNKDANGVWGKELVDPNIGGRTPILRLDSHDRPHVAYWHLGDAGADVLEPQGTIKVAEPLVADVLGAIGN